MMAGVRYSPEDKTMVNLNYFKVGKDPIVVVYGNQATKEFSMSDDLIGRPLGPFYEMRTWGKRRGNTILIHINSN